MEMIFTMSAYVSREQSTEQPATSQSSSGAMIGRRGIGRHSAEQPQHSNSRNQVAINIKDIPILTDLIREK